MAGIPEERVTLDLTMENLLELPPAASFSRKSGRANVKVERVNDTIRVFASCDSLERLCTFYRFEINRLRQRIDNEQQVTEKSRVGFRDMLSYLLTGMASGMFLTVLIFKRKK